VEIKKLLSLKNGINEDNFDDVLKNQIETCKKLREEINKKN
jgi:predicted transcriptional regulator